MDKMTFHNSLISKLNEAALRMKSGEHIDCPCCGADTMKRPNSQNPISTQYNVRICDICRNAEESLEKMHTVARPIWEWAYVQPRKPKGDFMSVNGHDAWAEIERAQIPMLMIAFREYFADDQRGDAEVRAAYDFLVRGTCKGAFKTDLFKDDAEVHYPVESGARAVTVIFRGDADGAIKYCAKLEQNKGRVEWLTE